MSIDTDQLKANNDIVHVIGQYVALTKEGATYKGLCPFHNENTPSFDVHPGKQAYHCFGCQEGGDVIKFIEKIKNISFVEACEYLGAEHTDAPVIPKPAERKAPKTQKAVPYKLPRNEAIDHYTEDAVQMVIDSVMGEGKFTLVRMWAYKDENGLVELMAVRAEDSNGKKAVLSVYWDGKSIKSQNYPVLLYNRDRLKNEPEKDVLIVFGEKCAEIADSLGPFIGTTWNGGEAKVKDADLSPLQGRTVYMWADDDEPGRKTAKKVIAELPHVQVVDIAPIADQMREIDPKGADIAEAMEVFAGDVDALTAFIYENAKRHETKTPEPEPVTETANTDEKKIYPFQVLGCADDGKCYFIGQHDRLHAFDPTAMTKNKLLNLATLKWWDDTFSEGAKLAGKKDFWDMAISEIIMYSTLEDFDLSRLRGRGAWNEGDGRICYHDGRKTHGEPSSNRIYLRRTYHDIGITGPQATTEERKKIFAASQELSFSTIADCVRTLGWSALAPFAGALPWRPCAFLTAESGSGKTTILDLLVKPLSDARVFTGADTTAAGVRQNIASDSCAIVLEEAEADTQKKRQNRDELLSLMRQSTSNDAPKVAKGTQDGKGVQYEMRSMFFFIAIDPTIDATADENRTFRISLTKPGYDREEWLKRAKVLQAAVTEEITRKVRSYTWAHLKQIIELTERISHSVQVTAGANIRTAYADSLLLSAFLMVFMDKLEPTDAEIKSFVEWVYTGQTAEVARNETEEMVDCLLDSEVRDGSDTFTIRELLYAAEKGEFKNDDGGLPRQFPQKDAKRLLGMHGVGLTTDYQLAIAKNHPKIKRILDTGNGYHHMLWRHPRLIDKGKVTYLGAAASSRDCVIIGMDN